jgi:general secretion pathway protein K
MVRKPARRNSQRGAALLTAMVIVSLIATLASAMVWQQWRAVQVEAAERARAQGQWILAGATDWARLILREDAKADRAKGNNSTDNLGEPWAVPLAESNLSTFLAADKSDAGAAPDAFLSGTIIDATSLYNLQNLAVQQRGLQPQQAQEKLEIQKAILVRIVGLAGATPGCVDLITNGMRDALASVTGGASSSADAPLTPKTIDELTWFGVTKADIEKLRPYVTILPATPVPVNVNTASKEVISAVAAIDLATADRVVQLRAKKPFTSTSDAQTQSGARAGSFTGFSTNTTYFFVRGRLRTEDRAVEEQALMIRSGDDVKVQYRQRLNALDSPTPGG